jgi:hypothetical protein
LNNNNNNNNNNPELGLTSAMIQGVSLTLHLSTEALKLYVNHQRAKSEL